MDQSQLMALLVGARSAVGSLQCTGISRARDVPPDAGEWESTWAAWQLSDGRYRFERAKGTACFDGTTCWMVHSGGTKAFKMAAPLPSLLLKDAIGPQWLDAGIDLADLGDTLFDGRPCRSVDARTPDGEIHHSLIVDQATGLILKGRDERTGHEFELHDVVLNEDMDDDRFRPRLGPDVEVIEPPTRPRFLLMAAKATVRHCIRRRK